MPITILLMNINDQKKAEQSSTRYKNFLTPTKQIMIQILYSLRLCSRKYVAGSSQQLIPFAQHGLRGLYAQCALPANYCQSSKEKNEKVFPSGRSIVKAQFININMRTVFSSIYIASSLKTRCQLEPSIQTFARCQAVIYISFYKD